MSCNSRFAVAIHILGVLAYYQPERLTSEVIACSVSTNPVVIRRVLGDLRRAGLVVSRTGSGGGWQLQRPAESITLLQAYDAVREGALLQIHKQQPNPACTFGFSVRQALSGIFGEAEAVLESKLAQTTMADVLARVRAQACSIENSL